MAWVGDDNVAGHLQGGVGESERQLGKQRHAMRERTCSRSSSTLSAKQGEPASFSMESLAVKAQRCDVREGSHTASKSCPVEPPSASTHRPLGECFIVLSLMFHLWRLSLELQVLTTRGAPMREAGDGGAGGGMKGSQIWGGQGGGVGVRARVCAARVVGGQHTRLHHQNTHPRAMRPTHATARAIVMLSMPLGPGLPLFQRSPM